MKRERPDPSVKDPVCGMALSKRAAAVEYRHKGKTYYFCARACCDKFAANPDRYLDKGHRWRRLSHTNTHLHRQFGVVRFSKHR